MDTNDNQSSYHTNFITSSRHLATSFNVILIKVGSKKWDFFWEGNSAARFGQIIKVNIAKSKSRWLKNVCNQSTMHVTTDIPEQSLLVWKGEISALNWWRRAFLSYDRVACIVLYCKELKFYCRLHSFVWHKVDSSDCWTNLLSFVMIEWSHQLIDPTT